MILLDRYLLREFAKNTLLVLAAFVAIFLLVDFFERLDEFLKAPRPLALALKYFSLKIPFMVEQLVPVCILLGGVVCLGLLNHRGELSALKAGGIGIVRIVSPILAGGLLFSILTLAMCQWLLPATVANTNKILFEEVRGQVPKGIFRNGRFYYKGESGFYSFERPDPTQSRYEKFFYATWNNDYHLQMQLSAAVAAWLDGQWTFSRGQIKRKSPAGGYNIEIYENITLDLPETPADIFIPEYKVEELSLTELAGKGWAAASPHRLEARLKLYERLSFIFLGLPLLLLGLPVLLLVHQRWGQDLSLAIPLSCVLAFAVWGGWGALQSLARTAHLHPALAAVGVHLPIGLLGWFLIKKQVGR